MLKKFWRKSEGGGANCIVHWEYIFLGHHRVSKYIFQQAGKAKNNTQGKSQTSECFTVKLCSGSLQSQPERILQWHIIHWKLQIYWTPKLAEPQISWAKVYNHNQVLSLYWFLLTKLIYSSFAKHLRILSLIKPNKCTIPLQNNLKHIVLKSLREILLDNSWWYDFRSNNRHANI